MPKVNLARAFRKDPSVVEDIAWKQLRGRKMGFYFRRQHPIGPYILDFYCAQAKLAVEFDGEQHEPARDLERDQWLNIHGITVLRIPNLDVVGSTGSSVPWFERVFERCVEITGKNPFNDQW